MKKPVPFDFVLEELYDLNPTTRPMFGCTAVYVGLQIVLVLRERDSSPRDNGVWIATTKDHHASLKKELPSMRSIEVFGTEVTGWQNLPSQDSRFEAEVLKACELIKAKDLRIGKIPTPKKAKRKTR